MKTNRIIVLAPAIRGANHAQVSDAPRPAVAPATARQDSCSLAAEFARIRSSGRQAAVDLANNAALNAILHPALSRLYDDFLLARNLCLTRSDELTDLLALKFADLQSLGLSEDRTRWLILKGYFAELETPGESGHGPTSSLAPPMHFGREGRARLQPSSSDAHNRPPASRNLSPDTLLVLTPAGFDLLQAILTLLESNAYAPLADFGGLNVSALLGCGGRSSFVDCASATCRIVRLNSFGNRSTTRASVCDRLCKRCHRSATCCACGAPMAAPFT
jgi:hypothetical protein